MAPPTYRVIDGCVEVASGDEVIWWGEVAGGVAYEAITVPGSDDGIMTLNWMHPPEGVETWHPFRNLMRIHPDGTVVWTAPRAADSPPLASAEGCCEAGVVELLVAAHLTVGELPDVDPLALAGLAGVAHAEVDLACGDDGVALGDE